MEDGLLMLKPGAHIPCQYMAREARTVGDMFMRRVQRSRVSPAAYVKKGGRWVDVTWGELSSQVRAAARGMRDLGAKPGDRIAILGPTTVTWGSYDTAAQLCGLVSFGIYPKQSIEQIRDLLSHSEAVMVLVDEEEELDNVLAACEGLEHVRAIVPWSQATYAKTHARDSRIKSPETLAGEELDGDTIGTIQKDIDPEARANLVYTSTSCRSWGRSRSCSISTRTT